MKNDQNPEIENPAELSAEDLLRFLEAVPQILRERECLDALQKGPAATCPDAELYLRSALGELSGEKCAELEAHAAGCPECAKRLTGSRMALEGNPSAAETAAIAELAAARSEWQQKMAREMARTPRRGRLVLPFRGVANRRRWFTATGMAAAVLIALGLLLWQREGNTPERELAKAYERSRTLELRVPEAGFAAFTPGAHTRGAGTDQEQPALLEARAKLARELERTPQDGHWLELQARADVLEERYDSAIDVLDRLLAQGPVTAELLTDAANAYYQRGLVTSSEVDRSTALDDLARADKLTPTDPVVLFNEAIVMEDRGQMMNAVEVWNRYITIERDGQWREEGKRKLAALEQTLNRLKSHESRVRQMLATPEAMDALAKDAKTLAAIDEELSAYKLDQVVLPAFPEGKSPASGLEQARGSPCPATCVSARRLLHAIGHSLEIQHRDFWLTDLLPPEIDSLPAGSAEAFGDGLRLLARAMRDDMEGAPKEGAQLTLAAHDAFRRSERTAGNSPQIKAAEHVAELRSEVEHLFALQLQVNFDDCRTEAEKLRREPDAQRGDQRYPWITGQAEVIEKVCDDTPETRQAGRRLAEAALRTAEADHYQLLRARASLMIASEFEDSGDMDAAERLVLASLAELYAADSSVLRIMSATAHIGLAEVALSHSHSGALGFQEALQLAQLGGLRAPAVQARVHLAEMDLRNGETREAEEQLRLANSEGSAAALGKAEGANQSQGAETLASYMLESGDLSDAGRYLEQAAKPLMHTSDIFLVRKDAMNRGQLALALGHADQSASMLESAIRLSEGSDVRRGDRATGAEFGEEDHDAYAELAASWLAQGRSPESVLALWERFRLRSRGLAMTQCRDGALDCELPRLLAEQSRLGGNIVFGQIVLLDRVLTYRVDSGSVRWSERRVPRQRLLDQAQRLGLAVSSPYTSAETAAVLGAGLANTLLPDLPANLPDKSSLLLEPDPMLANLSWPVLPTAAGPLGLAYPLAEMRSILVPASEQGLQSASGVKPGERALVVGASVATQGEPPLPEALSEARHVEQLLHAPEVLLGERATAARVGADLGSATIFHFAGHAVQTANGTELLLAADSPGDTHPWVDGKFLTQHPPRACRLAVLSACATGTREATWNHPLQSIVETFGALGVPEVVATRWQIDSEASVPFIDAFYTGLANGNTVAMALTSARRVQFENLKYRNPYYWGAYYVTGREIDHPPGELHARR